MRTFPAKHAKNAFGELIDTARAQPVAISKHGRPVVVVLAYELFEKLSEVPGSKKAKSNPGRR